MRIYTICQRCAQHILYDGPDDTGYTFCASRGDDYRAQLERKFLAAVESGDDTEVARVEELIVRMDTAAPRLAEAALLYSQWGWPVFPLRPGGKEPMTRHGFKEASTDEATVRAWWSNTPRANIGVPTGQLFDVLDVDVNHGAARVWPDLRDSDAMPTAHGIALTQSGGLHVFLLPSGGGNSAGMGDLPGIDYRGRGGYVVLAPSVMADGNRYQWTVKPSPMLRDTAPAIEVAA